MRVSTRICPFEFELFKVTYLAIFRNPKMTTQEGSQSKLEWLSENIELIKYNVRLQWEINW
jgi:hypothetical protein